MSRRSREYSEDLFEDTRMTIPDHIEDLRGSLVRALLGLAVGVFLGFGLDAIGTSTGLPLGMGWPVLKWIQAPVEEQVRDYHNRRIDRVRKRFDEENKAVTGGAGELPPNLRASRMFMQFDSKALAALGVPGAEERGNVVVEVTVAVGSFAADLEKLRNEEFRGSALTALSVQEVFITYFWVTLICGLVVTSPWVFYQIWAFVAAGMYPHEKRLVHVYMPFSVALFIGGVILCQFGIMPTAIRALLSFNEWLGVEPDLRLSEYLSLAITLPVVFGVSFQTPLVMLFLSAIGLFTSADYLSKWRYAFFFMAVFSALFTPTPDAITMLCLWAPMFGLYLLGALLCRWAVPAAVEEPDGEVAV